MTSDKEPALQRGRPRNLDVKQSILAATRETLLETGYVRLTIGGVAARAGAGKATIYRWWPSKGDLILDAVSDHIAIGVVPDTGDTRQDLRIAIQQLTRTFMDPLASIVIHAAIADLDGDPNMATRFRQEWVYPWRVSAMAAIERGVQRGNFDADVDPQFHLDVIVGTVLQRSMVQAAPLVERLDERLADLILPRPTHGHVVPPATPGS